MSDPNPSPGESEAARRDAEQKLNAAGDELSPQMQKKEAQLKVDQLRENTGTEDGIAGGNPGNNPEPQPPR